jgi:hypothetical protein
MTRYLLTVTRVDDNPKAGEVTADYPHLNLRIVEGKDVKTEVYRAELTEEQWKLGQDSITMASNAEYQKWRLDQLAHGAA